MSKGYRDLEIFTRSQALAVRIHLMTISLPRFVFDEEGSQIRRSSKSVTANFVEGYCLRKHKAQWLLFLSRAHASANETLIHLEFLHMTASLRDELLFRDLHAQTEELCRMLHAFIATVSRTHRPPPD